jgi:hypothetical protein
MVVAMVVLFVVYFPMVVNIRLVVLVAGFHCSLICHRPPLT